MPRDPASFSNQRLSTHPSRTTTYSQASITGCCQALRAWQVSGLCVLRPGPLSFLPRPAACRRLDGLLTLIPATTVQLLSTPEQNSNQLTNIYTDGAFSGLARLTELNLVRDVLPPLVHNRRMPRPATCQHKKSVPFSRPRLWVNLDHSAAR